LFHKEKSGGIGHEPQGRDERPALVSQRKNVGGTVAPNTIEFRRGALFAIDTLSLI